MKAHGFPSPVTKDGSHCAVSDLLDWVVQRKEELLTFVSRIADLIER
jgi:hypothetical protein